MAPSIAMKLGLGAQLSDNNTPAAIINTDQSGSAAEIQMMYNNIVNTNNQNDEDDDGHVDIDDGNL